MGAGNTQGGMSQPAVPIAFGSSAEPRNPAMLPYGNSDYMTGGQSGAKDPGQEGYLYPGLGQRINPHTGQVSQNQAGAGWNTRNQQPNNSYNWAPGQFEGLMQGIAQTQQQMQAMNLPQVNGWNAQNLGQAPGTPPPQAGTVLGGPSPYSGTGFTGNSQLQQQLRPSTWSAPQAQPYLQQRPPQFNPLAMGGLQNPYLLYALMASMGGMR